MDQSKIQKLFNRGQYAKALDRLLKAPPSPWVDTSHLRCLRALGYGSKAKGMAERLHLALETNDLAYPISISELNHQLRYIALVFAERGRAKDACSIMRKLVEKSPTVAALHREYAFALTSYNKLMQAEKELDIALNLEPKNANSHTQLARIHCRTGRVSQGYNSYVRAATLDPKNPHHSERLLYWSNYCDHSTQQSNYQMARRWVDQAHPQNQAMHKAPSNADSSKPLNIGFISSDFYRHSQSFFILPLLKGLTRDQFQVIAYSDTRTIDSVTASIQELCDTWHDTTQLSDNELAKRISQDQLDILIDLNGHAAGNRLSVFAQHVAPIQASWLGYPATTGLKSIGYKITDRIADPVGPNDRFFSEELLRLPNGLLCYQPLESAPKIVPTDARGQIRFGSFNNPAKASALTIDLWAAALHAVPNSTLYLKRQQLSNDNCRAHFLHEFEQRGISQERLILKTSNANIEQHLNEYNSIDIALDTVPCNGKATTLEALWMGVPVITLVGNTTAGRISSSILARLGLSNLACENFDEFVSKVQTLSEDQAARSKLRESLRKTMRKSALMNNQQFAEEFGSALRIKWLAWAEKSPIESGPATQDNNNGDSTLSPRQAND